MTTLNNPSACVPTTGAFSYAATIGRNQQPDNCFRLRVVGNAAAGTPKLANYLSGYSVELAAKDSEVAWGDVDWEDEPFADLKCESMTFVVADQVDVCAMFEDEVDQALEGGWGGSKGTVDVAALAAGYRGQRDNGHRRWRWQRRTDVARNRVPGPSPDRFRTLWFDDNLNTKIRKDSNASFPRPGQGDDADSDGDGDIPAHSNGLHDLYNSNDDPATTATDTNEDDRQHRGDLADG